MRSSDPEESKTSSCWRWTSLCEPGEGGLRAVRDRGWRVPRRGGIERLYLLAGRARALEVIVSGEDYDADTAERYGWVNRSIPDAELDAFVERFATRVASFDREAMSIVKQCLNHLGGVPDPADLLATQSEFFRLLQRPEAQAIVADLFRRGLQTRGDLELNLGERVGPQPNGNRLDTVS